MDAQDFPGHGKIKCMVCGRPVIEHEVGPECPYIEIGVDPEQYARTATRTDSMGRNVPRFRRQQRR